MRSPVSRSLVVLASIALLAGPAAAQFVTLPVGTGSGGTISTFATPLPPGPGCVPLTLPSAPFVAPVLLPVGAPTAAPVAIYSYPGWQATAQPACEPSTGCDRPGRWWVAADFLYAATQGVFVPPLVTASPAGTPQGGALYSPTTHIVLGNKREGNDFRPGFRVQAGYWFDDTRCRGLEASYFALGDESESFVGVTAPGSAILARPIVFGPTATNIGAQTGGPTEGGLTASVDTRFMGGDANFRCNLCSSECGRLDALLGYRYLHLGDTVDVWRRGTTTEIVHGIPSFIPFLEHDSFRTRNNFHGAQVGLVGLRQLGGGFFVEGLLKVALGVTVADVNIEGTTQRGFDSMLLSEGLLARRSNSVAETAHYFGVVPEAGLKLGYEFCEQWRATLGYTFLYWNEVRRAPDQIDLTTLQPNRPAFPDRTTDLWMHGFSAGLQFRY